MDRLAVDPLFLQFQTALAGRFSIDREVGRGGMGVVYLAREVHLDRPVAIKLLPPDRAADARTRERFLREAQLAARLSHPNVIPIHSVNESGAFVYYVMAFVDGETLTERVRSRGPLPASEAIRILREVAWALAHAHAQGLVHRDVKPDNILLEAGSGRALVADFGIAAGGDEATGDLVCGTPEFMSPEQALGGTVDARSDLYALGATAFFMLSGRLPFEGDTPTAVLARQVAEPAPSLSVVGPAVPRHLAQLVERCLAKDPGARPASADAVADQLGAAIARRRELPAALRAFVKRSGRIDGGGTFLAFPLLLAGTIVAGAVGGATAAMSTFYPGGALLAFAYLVHAARRLTTQGFAHADLTPAFERELELTKEERAVDYSRGASIAERILKWTAAGSWAATAVSLANTIWGTFDAPLIPVLTSGVALAVSMSTAVVSGTGVLFLLQRRRDVDTEFWSRVWTGRIGRIAFAIARRLTSRRVPATAVTHRATELALGMAATQLFDSLPRETRKALGDVPQLLERLQGDAQRLRRRGDALHEALNDAPSSTDDGGARAALGAERDLVQARLSEAVGALEAVRLDLLRLHAGTLGVGSLTTQLAHAAEVSAQVERLMEAREDVERSLARGLRSMPTPA